jgi:8-oxo-dGTP pyrophosphatase MutT (NUDIX family)
MTLAQAVRILTSNCTLPGDKARDLMMPGYRRNLPLDQPLDPPSEGSSWREAAVLILLYEEKAQARFPLILRVDGPGVHAGQVSLPGGAREASESLQACAIRETAEEIGVDTVGIQIIRELSPLQVPPSRFAVQPFVGVLNQVPAFRLEPGEVSAIMVPSIDELLAPNSRKEEMLTIHGQDWLVPCYRLAAHRVWGATAMILAELSALLGQS